MGTVEKGLIITEAALRGFSHSSPAKTKRTKLLDATLPSNNANLKIRILDRVLLLPFRAINK